MIAYLVVEAAQQVKQILKPGIELQNELRVQGLDFGFGFAAEGFSISSASRLHPQQQLGLDTLENCT